MEGGERTSKHSSSQNLKLINFQPQNKGPGDGKANRAQPLRKPQFQAEMYAIMTLMTRSSEAYCDKHAVD